MAQKLYEPDRGGIKKFRIKIVCPHCSEETEMPISDLTTGTVIYAKLTKTCKCGKYQFQLQYLNTGNVLVMHRTRTARFLQKDEYGKWHHMFLSQGYSQPYSPDLTKTYRYKSIEYQYVRK
ncbi:MAG: hypothetical protein ACOZAO_01170 [Patescibacteria group bacterium]